MKRRSFFGFDIFILCAMLMLMVIGVLFIYSSGVSSTGISYSDEYKKQIVWIVTGIILMVLIISIRVSQLKAFSLYIYVFFILLLILTKIFGKVVNGARSWIGFPDIGIQPSEFAKIATILFLAFYYDYIGKKIVKLKYFLLGFIIILFPVSLILIQPDLGTAIVYFPIFIIMTLIAGAQVRHLLFLFLTGVILIILVVLPYIESQIIREEYPVFSILKNIQVILILLAFLLLILGIAAYGFFAFKKRVFFWIMYGMSILTFAILGSIVLGSFIKDYQIKRIITFLNPYIDRRDAGWNIIQSITAIGSGGLFGKGFLMGTQSHYQYLPQQSTDFIFSIIAEEWGFFGGILVVILFMIILLRGISVISNTNDRYAVFVGLGIITMIFFHAVINIGMAMGIMPITGIPLFFLSYGGSSLWTALIGIGILLNISFK
ncbi:MAG: rod shape-determining protein RodA [Spirochaetales bacterium]|nr:rod shape-determining protein RodA [Spirochaetales bacterium]